jgi:hypothetical protein
MDFCDYSPSSISSEIVSHHQHLRSCLEAAHHIADDFLRCSVAESLGELFSDVDSLLIACSLGHVKWTNELLSEPQSEPTQQYLWKAIQHDHAHVVRLLCNHGLQEGWNEGLHLAVQRHCFRSIQMMVLIGCVSIDQVIKECTRQSDLVFLQVVLSTSSREWVVHK